MTRIKLRTLAWVGALTLGAMLTLGSSSAQAQWGIPGRAAATGFNLSIGVGTAGYGYPGFGYGYGSPFPGGLYGPGFYPYPRPYPVVAPVWGVPWYGPRYPGPWYRPPYYCW